MANEQIKAAKDDLYRQVIADAAEAVIAEHGYDDAKVSDIADRAGVSLGTLYKVFGAKADLHAAVHARRAAEILAVATEAVAGVDSPTLLMLRAIGAYIRYLVRHPAYLRILVREGYAWTDGRQMPLTAQREAWGQGFQLCVTVVGLGVAAGELVPGPVARHARLMIAVMQVMLEDWAAGGMVQPPDELVRDTVDAIVRVLATAPHRERWTADQEFA